MVRGGGRTEGGEKEKGRGRQELRRKSKGRRMETDGRENTKNDGEGREGKEVRKKRGGLGADDRSVEE